MLRKGILVNILTSKIQINVANSIKTCRYLNEVPKKARLKKDWGRPSLFFKPDPFETIIYAMKKSMALKKMFTTLTNPPAPYNYWLKCLDIL